MVLFFPKSPSGNAEDFDTLEKAYTEELQGIINNKIDDDCVNKVIERYNKAYTCAKQSFMLDIQNKGRDKKQLTRHVQLEIYAK